MENTPCWCSKWIFMDQNRLYRQKSALSMCKVWGRKLTNVLSMNNMCMAHEPGSISRSAFFMMPGAMDQRQNPLFSSFFVLFSSLICVWDLRHNFLKLFCLHIFIVLDLITSTYLPWDFLFCRVIWFIPKKIKNTQHLWIVWLGKKENHNDTN